MAKFQVWVKKTELRYIDLEAENARQARIIAKMIDDWEAFHTLDPEEIWEIGEIKEMPEDAPVDLEFQDMFLAKTMIRDFCKREYDSEADFSDMQKVPVAYTENDEGIPVEVYVDLINFRSYVTLGGKEIKETKYDTLDEMIERELEFLDFDSLVSDGM